MHWAAIQARYDPDALRHYGACAEAGLDVPVEVFEQLFHDHHGDYGFEPLVRAVDWVEIGWTLQLLTGGQLRQIRVPRAYQHAVDEARALTLAEGLQDDRPTVVDHWRDVGTWLVPPVIVAEPMLGVGHGDEILVGFTRLGNLYGLLDRGDVPGSVKHRVWLGRRAAS